MGRDPRVEPRQKDCVEKISGMQYFVIDRTPRTVTAITNPRSFCVKYSIKNWREEFATAIIIHAEGE
jgi:hypothetical protein